VTPGRRRRVDTIPEEQTIIVGVNIRTLRQCKGWSQAKLAELMGWQNAATVCAAEGRRDGRQRGFTTREIERLAAIFGVSPRLLTMQCANCYGQPPAGFACLACGATLGGHSTAATVIADGPTR
jgi:transcriptional regulator with XRE-family HTH domain